MTRCENCQKPLWKGDERAEGKCENCALEAELFQPALRS